jgi:sulfite exporter TauE/SafE
MQGLGWLTIQSASLRPVWTLFHVAAAVLGLVLLWNARQPVWLESVGRSIWAKARTLGAGATGTPLLVGTLWAFLPCGLLYSALLVAAMAGGPLDGAAVMALFALGTSVTMTAGPWLWLRLRGASPDSGAWGVRLAGAALTASSGWALWMGLVNNNAPWCVT